MSIEFILVFLTLNPIWLALAPAIAFALGVAVMSYWAWRRENSQGTDMLAGMQMFGENLVNLSGDEAAWDRQVTGILATIKGTTGRTSTRARVELIRFAKNDRDLLKTLSNKMEPEHFIAAARAFTDLVRAGVEKGGTESPYIVLVGLGRRTPASTLDEISETDQRVVNMIMPQATLAPA